MTDVAGDARQGRLLRPGTRLSTPRVPATVSAFFANPVNVLGVVLILALIARALWLWLPHGQLIFDESYYVNAARVILGWDVPANAPYADAPAGLDPNAEHPPLGKVLMAASMAVFGDNGIGWRLPTLIAGMVALLALYGIVRAAGETPRLGILAVSLFALDNLALVHARVGTLDMMALTPLLIGTWLALRGQWVLAGVACAIGSLVKLTGAFGLLALLILQAISLFAAWRRTRRIGYADLRPMILLGSSYAVVAIAGLWLLDWRFSGYGDPWAHLSHMMSFGAALQAPGGPTGIASNPWQWLVNEVDINYLRVAVDTRVNGEIVSSVPSIDVRGAMNPVLIGTAPLAFLFAASYAWRKGNVLALWAIVWAAASYLPYYPLVILNSRITYLYYFLPVIPALAVAVALLLRRARLPNSVTWGYLGLMVWGFLAYFPFRRLP